MDESKRWAALWAARYAEVAERVAAEAHAEVARAEGVPLSWTYGLPTEEDAL